MEKPSAKAITERIGRIRKDVKNRIGVTPCPVPKTPAKPKATATSKTPGSRAASNKKAVPASDSAKKKRKLNNDSDEEPASHARIPAREAQELQTSSASLFGTKARTGVLNTAFEDLAEARPKRAASAAIANYIKAEESLYGDDEFPKHREYEDSGTEYGEPEDQHKLLDA
jgi:hypothetical protein